jgi:hypothetical protein
MKISCEAYKLPKVTIPKSITTPQIAFIPTDYKIEDYDPKSFRSMDWVQLDYIKTPFILDLSEILKETCK